jgi:hypothetical protein
MLFVDEDSRLAPPFIHHSSAVLYNGIRRNLPAAVENHAQIIRFGEPGQKLAAKG